jgi:hypothetical protein
MTDEQSAAEEQQWASDQRLESIASGLEPLGLHANVEPPEPGGGGTEGGAESASAPPAGRVLDRLLKLVGIHRDS